jgi:methylenetetrahydrofolate reductase (NADPH)
MKIKDLFHKERPIFSFEFFPPKSEDAERSLYKAIERLKPLHPSFISVTCGAMGTNREKTAELAFDIKHKLGTESMAHVTCVALDRDEIHALLRELKEKNIKNILALRGDPPEDEQDFKRPKNGFGYAVELVRFIREEFKDDFSIAVAGYPEGHPQCTDKEKDLIHLGDKVKAGADFVITQLFFKNEHFFSFRDRAKRLGITVPIIPGIMPITNVKQLSIFAEKCGVHIPDAIREKVKKIGHDKEALEDFGIDLATAQCQDLLKAGVPGIHFYTLNRSKATKKIFRDLDLETGS